MDSDSIDSKQTDEHRPKKRLINKPWKSKIVDRETKKKIYRETKPAITSTPKRIIPETRSKQTETTKYTLDQNIKEEMKRIFAKRLEKCQEEFEIFCENYRPIEQQIIRSYPIGFFGPNPFGNIEIKERPIRSSANQTNLPLKFPWNGVFSDEKRVVNFRRPEVLFSFEQNQ